ncbi:hypothetical protein B0A75_15510 [Flavobacterium oncorhynchi]|uniref:FRG domain-containing protein n=1 Tax=Flavobacterium oncorhynchi TaxID=728056 RepID=A0A226HVH3_9FLAO|nr:FRG domain-containing protein [Flavobacterium oncorhynchi]OXA98072.1 hypothetical protein B0A75_15510 [Flavobacterium oncorhynchi]
MIEPVTTITEFLKNIEELTANNEKLWFRGLENSNFKLCPSIYRPPFASNVEEHFLNKFSSRAIPFLTSSYSGYEYWHWLFLMQHHGVPTRLLDWSSSAITALAFAVLYRDEKHKDADAVVWCLNPILLNDENRIRVKLIDNEKIPDITLKKELLPTYKFNATGVVKYPVAITGPLNNSRIVAQKGTFTLFPDTEAFNLEDTEGASEFLTKITLCKDHIESLKRQLSTLGVTESTIYPELSSLALEIKREFIEPLITLKHV